MTKEKQERIGYKLTHDLLYNLRDWIKRCCMNLNDKSSVNRIYVTTSYFYTGAIA